MEIIVFMFFVCTGFVTLDQVATYTDQQVKAQKELCYEYDINPKDCTDEEIAIRKAIKEREQ